MPSKKRSGNKKKSSQSNFAKLSIFQPNKYKFKKNCPLSPKGAPEVDYKNIRLLKRIKKASICTLRSKGLEKLLMN